MLYVFLAAVGIYLVPPVVMTVACWWGQRGESGGVIPWPMAFVFYLFWPWLLVHYLHGRYFRRKDK